MSKPKIIKDDNEPEPISDTSLYWYEKSKYMYQLGMMAMNKYFDMENKYYQVCLLASLFEVPVGSRTLQ
ncbi:hypothetical protein [Sinanaerobacter chloroacetimidivorans]|uniref:Uncharacterized protein n=1 Tax=Sinanaerobacter chloroacetimidivorans TaxID=2818044 RepID=A0A8J7W4Y6_9FIRM|nr:hypothetical protein [Sinanaerobacter chloroacetimidivorans]MBR0599030.1 hypothetical protein [Sinanaerobacter chloroacetimidivorans]